MPGSEQKPGMKPTTEMPAADIVEDQLFSDLGDGEPSTVADPTEIALVDDEIQRDIQIATDELDDLNEQIVKINQTIADISGTIDTEGTSTAEKQAHLRDTIAMRDKLYLEAKRMAERLQALRQQAK